MSQIATELKDLVDDVVGTDGPAAAAAGRQALWSRFCELGLHRVGVAEERGGSGGGFDDLLVVVQALAGHAVGVPIVEASTADWVLSHSRGLDGALTTLALLDRPLDPGTGSADGSVTAELSGVPWAREADRVLLCAPDSAPLLVDLRDPSVSVRPGENLAGEPRDTVVLAGTPAEPLASAPDGEQIRVRLALLWSAAVAGAAHGAYRLTKEYVAQREQFGAPLLKIPAVAGNLALMRVQLVQVDAALALARESGPAGAGVEVARLTTAAAATEIARLAHQLHGAMGVTQEYPLHHYTRRLWAWRDAVAVERDWAERLGRRAAGGGETVLWTELTATGR